MRICARNSVARRPGRELGVRFGCSATLVISGQHLQLSGAPNERCKPDCPTTRLPDSAFVLKLAAFVRSLVVRSRFRLICCVRPVVWLAAAADCATLGLSVRPCVCLSVALCLARFSGPQSLHRKARKKNRMLSRGASQQTAASQPASRRTIDADTDIN